jgi:hypothetical protein
MRLAFVFASLLACVSFAAEPASQPGGEVNNFPGIHVDVKSKQIRVDCEMIDCKAPLEFFTVVSGTNEHESVLRTKAQPSKIHLALIMLGLEPGEGVKYSDAAKKWFPPHGPPLNISCEFERDGKLVHIPAYRMMRDLHTKKEMPPMTWIFVGSRVMDDGHYAADVTGYVVSVVNFELTLIDIPDLASSANETLEWEINWDVVPKGNTPVTMIIEPAGAVESATSQPTASAPATQPISDVTIDQPKVDRLVQLWTQKVAPHDAALREAAQAQYETITELRREQQRLIDEADRIQRTIDELEKKYQDMTTPRPEAATRP